MKLDLEFQDDVPDGWTTLEATVVYKALDELGVVRLGQTSTQDAPLGARRHQRLAAGRHR